MKRTFFLMTAVLMGVMAWAQPKVQREWDFGVLGGPALSTYSFIPSVTQDMSKGYTAGVAFRYIEEKIFGLQGELLLTRRGMKDRYDSNPDFAFERQLTYVEVPLMAHIYFGLGQKSQIAFDAGPKAGILVGDVTKTNLTNNAEFESFLAATQAQNSRFHGYAHHTMAPDRKFDYGIQAGLGYEFKFNRQVSLQLQGRFYFGLGNLFNDTKADVFEQSSTHTVQIVAALWWHQFVKIKR